MRPPLRRGLTGCSLKGTGLRIRKQDRFRRNTKLCFNASAFFYDVNCKMRPAQSNLGRSAAEELERSSDRLGIASMQQFVDDSESYRID